MSNLLLIKNGEIADSKYLKKADILIKDGKIAKILESKEAGFCYQKTLGLGLEIAGARIIDAGGLMVLPGFIDLHAHFRDPGYIHKEDLQTGQAAAAAGGFTTVCVMPNTKPVADSAEAIRYIIGKAGKTGLVNVLPVGAVTKGQNGRELADIEEMRRAGAAALSEDGKSVGDERLMRAALELCARLDMPMLSHCEELSLVGGGVINEGEMAGKLRLSGIPNAAEDRIIARDIVLARESGARLHICHLSTKGGVALVRGAKAAGEAVTAEAAPHHFTLCDRDIPGDDGNFKMNPPLRAPEDRDAVKNALLDGTIDCVATDHAPHSAEEKSGGFRKAANGIIGLETAFALAYTELVRGEGMSLQGLAAVMSANPARLLKLPKGEVREGFDADLTIADLSAGYKIPGEFKSKSANTPFVGREVFGRVKYTIRGGEIVYKN